MDILREKSKLLTLLGLTLVVLSGAGGWVTVKILTRPGPRQEFLAREEAELKMRTAEQKQMDDMQEKYTVMLKQLEALPKFEAPKDGIISPDRMAKYVNIRWGTVIALLEEQKAQPPPPRTITQGIILANRMMLVVQGAQVMKSLENLMPWDEYEWIEKRIYEAQIVALLKLKALTTDPQIRKTIHGYAAQIAVILGYSQSDEKGEFIGHPERMDQSIVPPQHLRYALQYYKKLGQPQVWVNELDWTPLLKAEGVDPL